MMLILLMASCKHSVKEAENKIDYSVFDSAIIADYTSSDVIRTNYLRCCQIFDSLAVVDSLEFRRCRCRLRIELAENLRKSGNYDEGLFFLNQALGQAYDDNDVAFLAEAHNRLAAIFFEIFFHKNNPEFLDSTRFHITQSLTFAKKSDDQSLVASNLIIDGALNYLEGDYDQAERLLTQAQKSYQMVGEQPDWSLWGNMAKTYIKLGKLSEALTLAQQLHREAVQARNFIVTAMSLRLLMDVYDSIGLTKEKEEARFQFEKMQDRQDYIVEHLLIRHLATQYQLKQSDVRILRILKERVFLVKLSSILLFVIVNLVVVFFLLFYLLRQKSKAIRFENDLLVSKHEADKLTIENKELAISIKEAEARKLQLDLTITESNLAAKLLHIKRKNDFLIQMLERLKKLNLEVKIQSARDTIKEIIRLTGRELQEKDSEEFEVLYASGNSNFITNLTQVHPDLTSFEKRLCFLLHMNLSTKEISNITFQTCRAVEMARHRLRIKFNLDREANLGSYLAKFS